MTPFIIFSLPRSRSNWLSVVLSASGNLIGHDIGIETNTPEEFIQKLLNHGGTCETGAAFAWKEIRQAIPDIRIAVVLRDPEDVINSLERQGINNCSEEIYSRYIDLLEIANNPESFVCNFEDLNNTDIVCQLYQFCTQKEPVRVWIDKLQDSNIQINLQQRVARLEERSDSILKLKELIKSKSIGYTYQVEPWSNRFYEEVLPLASQHFDEVDGDVEPNRKLIIDNDLMQSMQNFGSLLILTARKDGKLIGYFTWQILPDAESKGLLIAQQGAWFVSPGHFKSAYKLFDMSVQELHERGVKCIFPHHRVQGRGSNLRKFFERKGAKLIQHTYSLWIGEDNG